MPYKKKRPAKKTYKKKRFYNKKKTMLSNPSGFPGSRITRLRFCDQETLTSTSGALTHYTYRANSIYDTDYTDAGDLKQPMGFDTWATLYNHYVVLGSKCSVKMLNDTSSANPIAYGAFLSDSSSAPYTTWQGMKEGKKGIVKFSNGRESNAPSAISMYSAKKFFNVKDIKDNQNWIGSTVSGNPTTDADAYFIVWMQQIDGSTDSWRAIVTIDYIVLFSDPVIQPRSF